MQDFDFVRKTELSDSFRVKSTIDRFTMDDAKFQNEFKGSFDLPETWSIGCIVGASGTGKTTIAQEIFPDSYITAYDYKEKSVMDDMPKSSDLNDIHRVFTSVGFATPPDWVKPYHVLSNGQKMRVDLARSILEDRAMVVFDEFTSVINREVAKTGSLAIAKAVRKTSKQFIAVTVHRDILDWLEPDWIFDTDTFTFYSKKDLRWQRPSIKLEIFETPKDRKLHFWKPLARYHYLDSKLLISARQFIGVIDGEVVAHTSYIQFPLKKGWKRGHRLVVHPDYQGIGIGTRFQKAVAQIIYDEGYTVISTSTTPALINALKRDKDWVLYRYGVVKNTIADQFKKTYKNGGITSDSFLSMSDKGSDKRITYSFCFKGRKTMTTKKPKYK